MGHIKRKRPRRGSLQFWPRKRAKRIYPRIRNFAQKGSGVLGFSGYKAGMTHVSYVDNRSKAATKGEKISSAVTVLEVPPIKVLGIRAYTKDAYGSHAFKEIWTDNVDKELRRRLTKPHKKKHNVSDLEKDIEEYSEIRLLVYTQPKLTALNKKKPEIFELGLGGKVTEQLDYAKTVLGKEIRFEDVFKPGDFVDIHAITKGKGLQGATKRFGLRLKSHKAEKGRRGLTTLGNWSAKTWRVAHPGQMGFHQRTEYNKQVFKVADGSNEQITPEGGFVNYGEVKGNYALIKGSVGGPKKRMIIMTHAVRPGRKLTAQAPELSFVSLKSQQQ